MKNLNRVICGDSRKELKKIPDGLVNLIYIDPPYFSNRDYEIISDKSPSCSFTDKWPDGLESYIEFIREIVLECHRILNKSGSLYLHCDPHASHYGVKRCMQGVGIAFSLLAYIFAYYR